MNNISGKPIISCIMPVYNVERELKRTIESLLQQSFKEFELICINDASTDQSSSILNCLSENDSRIIVLEQKENQGAARCRNKGLEISKGKYVIFLDSDDFFYPDMLQEAYSLMMKDNADVVTFGYCQKRIDEETEEIICVNEYSFPNVILEGENKNLSPLICDCVAPWNKLVKKELLLSNNITFQDIPNSNDVYYALTTMYSAQKAVFTEKVLIDYIVGRKGGISYEREKRRTYWVKALDETYKYLMNKEVGLRIIERYVEYVMKKLLWLTNYQEESRNFTLKLLEQSCILDELTEVAEKSGIFINKLIMEDVFHGRLREWKEYITDVAEIIIDDANNHGKKVALWGCGKRGKKIIDCLNIRQKKLHYAIDQSEDVRKNGYGGYSIYKYDDIKNKVDYIIVVGHNMKEEIHKLTINKRVIDLLEYTFEDCSMCDENNVSDAI